MSATHQNPNVPNTAARYVAKALLKVNPGQRAEMLRQIIAQAEEGLRTIEGVRRAA